MAGEVRIETDGWAAFECGTDIASHEADLNSTPGKAYYSNSPTTWSLTEDDFTGGQLGKAKVIKIKLDQERPLTEPKWTRGSLADHVDVNSRFLKILKLVDSETTPSLDNFFESWAGDSSVRSDFVESLLTANRLMSLLTSLMSTSNILTPAIRLLIDGLLSLVQRSGVPDYEIVGLLKVAIFQIPNHMLTKSLDSLYDEFLSAEPTRTRNAMALASEASMGGSKRQRGESEVPSEQLARTTLDEKRRRLRESDPQSPIHHAQVRERDMPANEDINQNQALSEGISAVHISAQEPPQGYDTEDGARMSREEMLRTLEDCEDHAIFSEPEPEREAEEEEYDVGEDDDDEEEEEEEEEGPVECGSLVVEELRSTKSKNQ